MRGGHNVWPVFTKMPVTVKSSNQAGWWTPFCLDSAGSQYFAFVAASNNGTANMHNLGIMRRDADGATTLGYLLNRDGRRAQFLDDNGHNQPSVAVDPDGNIFVITSMHGDYWNYYRSTIPRDVSSLVYAAEEMPDTTFNFTYPVLTTGSTGDVYLMVRGGASPNGFDRVGIVYRRDRARAMWERLLIVANEANNSFYPDGLRVDTANNVHILWEWGPWSAGVLWHKGSYLVASSAGAISSISGREMQTPVPVADDGDHVYHPLEEGEEFVSNSSEKVGTMAGIQTARLIYNAGTIYGVIYR
ncbi:BNR repeat-containing protein [Erwinia tracheiphila]|uniref:BNR-4 repeat-containing protein n=1 Tax=Erwinia tracheiphila TaxID=65700 RepID=UPI001F21D39D|nr:BNR-4 repeat-containing protein [Erwinia tracheiphila]UIA93457.1 BNR repeat-containing protein [Erwinia tracheiphila]